MGSVMKKLKRAFAIREQIASSLPRDVLIEVIENIQNGVPPDDDALIGGAARATLDAGALYAVQAGLSQAEFMAYAADSFELQTFLNAGSGGDPVIRNQRLQQLRARDGEAVEPTPEPEPLEPTGS
jgi:hypothetical protein